MITKQDICYEVLKRHNLVINYSGKSLGKVSTEVRDKETFSQWKMRVLGPNVGEVTVYAPVKTEAQTSIYELQKIAGGEHINKIYKALVRSKNKERKEAVSATEKKACEKYLPMYKDMLRDVINSDEGELEASLKEYFTRLLDAKTKDSDPHTVFKNMLKDYNNTVRRFREQKLASRNFPTDMV